MNDLGLDGYRYIILCCMIHTCVQSVKYIFQSNHASIFLELMVCYDIVVSLLLLLIPMEITYNNVHGTCLSNQSGVLFSLHNSN